MDKGAFCQFEWHRDNKELLPSQALAWGGFFIGTTIKCQVLHGIEVQKGLTSLFFLVSIKKKEKRKII